MSIIVDEQTKLDPFVRGGALLRPLHALDQVGRHAVAASDEAHPHPFGVQLRRLAVDSLAEHGHQAVHLLPRALPVLGRE